MPSRDKVVLRAAVLFFCSFLLLMANIQTARAQESFVFSFPSIPDTLTTVNTRAAYLVSHYWDKVSFPSALSSADNDSIEQAWVNYCDLFRIVPSAVVKHSLVGLIANKTISPTSEIFLMSLAEKYLFDTESPYRNDTTYLSGLEAFISRPDIDALYQQRYLAQLRMLTHCCEVSMVSDFSFVTDNGASSTLYQLSTPHTLLLLYNPECDHCQLVMEWMDTNSHVASLLSSGKLSILSVNIGEADDSHQRYGRRPHWIDIRNTIPNLIDTNLYDLRTFPLCLLLDDNKRIIGKATDVSILEQQLVRLL